MPIRVTCQCLKSFHAPDVLAGRTVKCPNCGSPLDIPVATDSESLFSDLEELASAAESHAPAAGPGISITSAVSGTPFAGRARRKLSTGAVVAGATAAVGLVLLVVLVLVLLPGGGGERRPRNTRVAQEAGQPTSAARGAAAPSVRTDGEGSRHFGTESVPPPRTTAEVVVEQRSQPVARGFVGERADAAGRDDTARSEFVSPRLRPGLLEWYGSGELVSTRRVGDAPLRELHYGWMVGLLPYLGYQEHFDRFDFSKPWHAEPNLQLTARRIPELLNPADRRREYHGRHYSGLAVTHFVGVSGVEDGRNVVAATLPRSDPRAGIFGYEEIATAEQIEGGAGHTLMMIGSGELACPWVQSGGSTVRGARRPYFGDLTGFGSIGGPGRGAIGVMADGSVRWVDANIDPEVFRRMCTIAD